MTEKNEKKATGGSGSGRTEVVHLAERSALAGGAASLTPVFDALVRDWRKKGREVPLRHKQAPSVRDRIAA